MPFGYIGQNQTKQKVKNSGVLSSFEISHLEKQGHAGGSLKLIEEQTISSSTAAVDFTNLGNFDVHFLTLSNFVGANDGTGIYVRLSNNGGSSFISSSYQYFRQRNYISSNSSYTQEGKSTSLSYLTYLGYCGNATGEAGNSHAYFYNLLDSSKYSCSTYHSVNGHQTGHIDTWFGGGIYPTAQTHNALRVYGSANIESAKIKLFGVKQ